MKRLTIGAFLLCLPLCLSTWADTLFDAARLNETQPLILANADECRLEPHDSHSVLRIAPGDDPYHEQSWRFTIEDPGLWSEPFALEIEFYDKGAGVIEAGLIADAKFNGAWSSPRRAASYTRLNTDRLRSAWFEFSPPPREALEQSRLPHLTITGLQYLKAIRIRPPLDDGAWSRVRESVPVDVQPMASLQRPIDAVCSAGVSVLGDESDLQSSLDALHELAPLARVLGFNGVESYVKWNLIEPRREGEFNFHFYDSVVEKLSAYGLKWFPLLIVGSAYSLPDWFVKSDENVGFVCLEHGQPNLIQSIWSPFHQRHVTRVLTAFGEHYEPMGVLLGVRLGPSGNYGESQYPAGGNWGYKGQPMHIHIGFWAGDAYAEQDFRARMLEQYGDVARLNEAWNESLSSFDEIKLEVPTLCYSKRKRLDIARWYTRSMSDWCEWWAHEARKAMPHTPIYQSAGGWGFLEAGTDYVDQAQAMVSIHGGIRLTNETDSFDQNFFATRLAFTAARLYGIDVGTEPASSHTARGTVGRMFELIASNGDHFFTYHPNLFNRQMAIDKWLEYYPLFDVRNDPVVDVAVYYPETMNQLDDGAFRHLYAWGFNPRAREVRRQVEVDYLNERLIREGFLDRYKVLVFCWGNIIDAGVEAAIDDWMRRGGIVIYPSFPRGDLETIDGDRAVFRRWSAGDVGDGAFHRFAGDMEPPSRYGEFVRSVLLDAPGLHPLTQTVLRASRPADVFFSVQRDGHVLMLNYSAGPAPVELDGARYVLPPYSILRTE